MSHSSILFGRHINNTGGYECVKQDDMDQNKEPTEMVVIINQQVKHDDSLQVRQKPTTTFVLVLTFFAAIGGFLFGYDTGVVSGALLLLTDTFHMSTVSKEIFVSITIAGACIFSLVGGYLNDKVGRRITTILASIVFTAGALILGLAYNLTMLIIGRAILGIGIGLVSTTVPIYIAECAPTHLRGQLVTLNQFFITGGQFVASLVDGIFSRDTANGWRYMLGLAAIPALIQMIGFIFLPESPRWLIAKGNFKKAEENLVKIRGSEDVEEEFSSIKEAMKDKPDYGNTFITMVHIIRTPAVSRALVIGCGMQLFQQLCGINTVMYYSASIIKMAGIHDNSQAIWLSSLTAGVNFIFSFVGIWLVERVGRRKLTLGSLSGVTVGLVILAVGFQLAASNSLPVTVKESGTNISCFNYNSCDSCVADQDCGFCYIATGNIFQNGSCLPANLTQSVEYSEVGQCSDIHGTNSTQTKFVYDFCPTNYSWMAILGLVFYLMFFAPGMGPMPWTVNAEIYPHWARGTANSIATSVNWISNLLVSMTFLTLTEEITAYGTYWLYVGITIAGLLFVSVCLPETKGLQLEEVECLFQNKTVCFFNKPDYETFDEKEKS